MTPAVYDVNTALAVYGKLIAGFRELNQAVDSRRVLYDGGADVQILPAGPTDTPRPFHRNVEFARLIAQLSGEPEDALVEAWRDTPGWDVPLTNCVSSHNSLKYLRLAVGSMRANSFFRNSPLLVHAENCTDGTDEWLAENQDELNYTYYAERNEVPRGIGGGMNFCAEVASTPYLNFVHADFYCGYDWDWELLMARMRYAGLPTMAFSYRVQPDIFGEILSRPGTIIVDPQEFGELHSNFDAEYFLEWSDQFRKMNDFEVPKAEGVSGLISREDWDRIGGNDPCFAPASFEDVDLFLRMQFEGYRFAMTSRSVVYHFGARSSHFPNDDFKHSDQRQLDAEAKNKRLWRKKWGPEPKLDEYHMWGTKGFEVRYEYLKKHNRLKRFNGQ